jgi:hypothetical protein
VARKISCRSFIVNLSSIGFIVETGEHPDGGVVCQHHDAAVDPDAETAVGGMPYSGH